MRDQNQNSGPTPWAIHLKQEDPMSPNIPYSAAKDDLFNPGRRNGFFSPKPQSDAALCAEMARLAYCRKEPEFGFDQERIQKLLGDIEFKPYRFLESQGTPHGTGAHCLLAVGGDALKSGKLAVVSFRGTDIKDRRDLLYDVDALLETWNGPGEVHKGFATALEVVRSRLEAAIREVGECRLLYTGHSLGAAMATLMAGVRRPDALYTFGCPRVGDAAFVEALKDIKSYRYVDCCDGVARVPPPIGYEHLGVPYYIQRDRQVTIDPSEKSMRRDRLFGFLDYEMRYALRRGNETWREFADHAPINYIWPVKASSP